MEQIEEGVVVCSVAPIVRIAHAIVTRAIEVGASEIHIEPGAHRMEVYYRTDGVLTRIMALPAHIYPNLVTRYKVMAEVSWASRHQPVKGHIAISHRGKQYDLEVIFPLRLLDEKTIINITGESEVGSDGEDSQCN